jgi:hypothetical protein
VGFGYKCLSRERQPVFGKSLYKFNIVATLAVPYKVFYVCLRLRGGCGHSGVCVCFEPSEDGLRFVFVNFTVEGGDKAHAGGNGPKH